MMALSFTWGLFWILYCLISNLISLLSSETIFCDFNVFCSQWFWIYYLVLWASISSILGNVSFTLEYVFCSGVQYFINLSLRLWHLDSILKNHLCFYFFFFLGEKSLFLSFTEKNIVSSYYRIGYYCLSSVFALYVLKLLTRHT